MIGTCEAAKSCYKICKVLSAAMLKLRFDENGAQSTTTPQYPQVIAAVSSNASPVDSLEGTLEMPKIKHDSFEVPLGQFFDELEKVTMQSDPESTRSRMSNNNSPQLPNALHADIDGDENAHRNKMAFDKDAQRVLDMVSQVTTDSIWNEFFGKIGINDLSSHDDGGEDLEPNNFL